MIRITQILLALTIFFPANGQQMEMTYFPDRNINPTEARKEYLMNINESAKTSGIENVQWEEGHSSEETNILHDYAMKKYTMNDEFQLDSIIRYQWDSETLGWIPYHPFGAGAEYPGQKELFKYDTNGNIILHLNYYITGWWVGTPPEAFKKDEYWYDTSGNQTLGICYYWDTTANDWVNQYKYEYSYDTNGNQTLGINYNWDKTVNDWVVFGRNEYTYDSNGNQILHIWYFWFNEKNDWGNWRKIEYAYDANGNLTLILEYSPSESENGWEGSTKEEYTYDANGNQILYMRCFWRDSVNDCVNSSKAEYTYDVHGNKTLETHYYWDETTPTYYRWHVITNNWALGSKEEFYYSKKGTDINLNISENSLSLEATANSTTSFIISTNTDWSITGLNSWLSADITSASGNASITLTAEENTLTEPRKDTIIISTNELSDRYVYVTQSGSIVGINKQYAGDINIYPNPAGELLHIEGLQKETIGSIYNANGQVIFSNTIDAENGSIHISGLPAGMYILKLETEEGVAVKRFTKE